MTPAGRQSHRTVGWTVSAVMVAACSAVAPTASAPSVPPWVSISLPAGAFELPTASTTPGLGGCAGLGYADPFVLTGDRTAKPVVWAECRRTRVSIVWPIGYYANFDPSLRVIDTTGKVVARQGDDLGRLQISGAVVCIGPQGGLVFTP